MNRKGGYECEVKQALLVSVPLHHQKLVFGIPGKSCGAHLWPREDNLKLLLSYYFWFPEILWESLNSMERCTVAGNNP